MNKQTQADATHVVRVHEARGCTESPCGSVVAVAVAVAADLVKCERAGGLKRD